MKKLFVGFTVLVVVAFSVFLLRPRTRLYQGTLGPYQVLIEETRSVWTTPTTTVSLLTTGGRNITGRYENGQECEVAVLSNPHELLAAGSGPAALQAIELLDAARKKVLGK